MGSEMCIRDRRSISKDFSRREVVCNNDLLYLLVRYFEQIHFSGNVTPQSPIDVFHRALLPRFVRVAEPCLDIKTLT